MPVIMVAAFGLVLCLGAVGWKLWWNQPSPSEDSPAVATQPPARAAQPKRLAPTRSSAEASPPPALASQAAVPPATAVVAPPPLPALVVTEPLDTAMSSLVTGLLLPAGTNALTAEALQAWKTNFQQLAQSGPTAIPAIRAFLAQNQDTVFAAETARMLGQRSARLAAFDALRQIGGPEAIALLDQTLGETKAPREIAALAWNLDSMAEGQYREKVLCAARGALAQYPPNASQGVDVAPLFEVFQKYGDAALVPELEQAAGRWKYYATSALANLPNGAGVPALMRMADPVTSSGDRLAALQALTWLAAQNGDARMVLISQVGGKQIPANFWPYLCSPLAGEQTYPADGVLTQYPNIQSWSDIKSTKIVSGNQNFYTLPSEAVQTAEGISQQLALLDQLTPLGGDPAALQALQHARDRLNQLLARLPMAPSQR